MTNISHNLLVFTMILSGFGAVLAFASDIFHKEKYLQSSKNAAVSVFILLTLLMGTLMSAFITHDFSYNYVASYSSSTLPFFYTISALWAGQAGSLLLWAWILSMCTVAVIWLGSGKNQKLIPIVIGVILSTTFFFISLMVIATDPFEKLAVAAVEGYGLNPMLQNPGMVLHPPTLFLGYIGFTVPFAYAIAALFHKRLDAQWIKTTRRWTLISWLFLTVGIILGAKWAYVELGWGGYWAWDPVENASFLPWLTATAYLHSIIIQENRGMLKVWNIVLVVATFALTIFGTFITRSGLIGSVHSFGLSNLGPLFLVFLAIIIIGPAVLLYSRKDLLKSDNRLDSIVSRESSFFFNNLILVSMAFAVFWGTLFPIISEAITSNKITVGAPFYNKINIPFGLLLLALTGICPLIGWRKTSTSNLIRSFTIPVGIGIVTAILLLIGGMRSLYPIMSFSLSAFVLVTIIVEFYRGTRTRARLSNTNLLSAFWDLTMRNKGRYGGYIVHLGIVFIFVGITGSSAFQRQKDAVLSPGESLNFGNYTILYKGILDNSDEHRISRSAELLIQEQNKPDKTIYPMKQVFKTHGPMSEVAIKSSLKEDLYVIFTDLAENDTATFKVFINPLVTWIWIGGFVMVLGTLIAVGPNRRKYNKAKIELPKTEMEVSENEIQPI